jgi:2,4-dienoyl-CoA reductase (NADPH2)
MAAAAAAERGHRVVLFEASTELGGQFNLARRIPGKEEFSETLRYFRVRLAELGVEVRLGERASAPSLAAGGFDEVVLATGVVARVPKLPGIDHPRVLRYTQAILHPERVGRRVALLGAGGIGFDVAELLAHPPAESDPLVAYQQAWGISTDPEAPGGLGPRRSAAPAREVTLCQRSEGKLGARLGKTTGWIHRASLAHLGVQLLAGCTYERIDDAGLHLTVAGRPRVLEVDHVVICAGQEPNRSLEGELAGLGLPLHRIGGCDEAAELDARRAIDQGTRLAARL